MRSPGAGVPGLLPGLISDWLAEHPGEHRARDVAAGIGRPAELTPTQWTRKVANAMAREARAGKLSRASSPGLHGAVYSLPAV